MKTDELCKLNDFEILFEWNVAIAIHIQACFCDLKQFVTIFVMIKIVILHFCNAIFRGLMTPLELVEGQLQAYNQRDLEFFCRFFADEIVVLDGRTREVLFEGMNAFKERYANTFQNEGLHCRLVHRIIQDDVIIDHEDVSGMGPEQISAVAVYRCENGLIQEVTFY